jgi:hypothetical protein
MDAGERNANGISMQNETGNSPNLQSDPVLVVEGDQQAGVGLYW